MNIPIFEVKILVEIDPFSPFCDNATHNISQLSTTFISASSCTVVLIKVHPKQLSTTGKLRPLWEIHCQSSNDKNITQKVFFGPSLMSILWTVPPPRL